MLGKVQMVSGRLPDALTTYQKLAIAVPKSARTQYQLGMARLGTNDASGAEAAFKKSLELQPDYFEPSAGLAMVYAASGRVNQAYGIAQGIQKKNPGSPLGYGLEGDVLMQQKEYARAARVYETGLKLTGNSTLTVKTYMALARSGNVKQGIARLQTWLA